jgi:hypothetical protein
VIAVVVVDLSSGLNLIFEFDIDFISPHGIEFTWRQISRQHDADISVLLTRERNS